MYIAEVIGLVVSTIKESNLIGQKLLIVQDINDRGTNKSIIAVDSVGVGIGELVMVVEDGGAARQAISTDSAPVNAAILGVVDYPEKYKQGINIT